MTTLDGPEELALYETLDVLAAAAPDGDMLASVLLDLCGLAYQKPRSSNGLTLWSFDQRRAEQAQHVARRWLRQYGHLPPEQKPSAAVMRQPIQAKEVRR